MSFEDYSRYISEFERLLQRVATDITSGVIFERLPPTELWSRAEPLVTSLRSLAEKLAEAMLLFKPEKTPTIKNCLVATLQSLDTFKNLLFQRTQDPLENSRLALEQLRNAIVKGSDLLQLAKSIKARPSEVIMRIIKFKEVYKTKDYISSLPVPEVIHLRFESLKKHLENLRYNISNLERALEDLRTQLDMVQNEISRFRPTLPQSEEMDLSKEASRTKSIKKEEKQSYLSEF